MICPACDLLKYSKESWTDAQWRQRRPNIGGRNHCKACWDRGPSAEDWEEAENLIDTLDRWEYMNIDLRYQTFMVSFLKVVGASRKEWSYMGVLPVRLATDYSTGPKPNTFDPTTEVYACVVRREVPHIQQCMGGPFLQTPQQWATAWNVCWPLMTLVGNINAEMSARMLQLISSGR